MSVPHLLIPDLQRLAADAIQDGQEAALEGVLKHFWISFGISSL